MRENVRYGRMGEVVILIFPDESGSKKFISKIETQNLLAKMGLDGLDKKPLPTIPSVDKQFQPRVVA
jgi:hypothetical protein